jgi:hypothetical protein
MEKDGDESGQKTLFEKPGINCRSLYTFFSFSKSVFSTPDSPGRDVHIQNKKSFVNGGSFFFKYFSSGEGVEKTLFKMLEKV